jgi:hypothetical protein
MSSLVIAIDFDGTIVRNAWPEIGKFRWLARPVLGWMKKRGHCLVLNTCRKDKYCPSEVEELYNDGYIVAPGIQKLSVAKECLWNNGIKFDYYNRNAQHLIDQYGDCRKIGADLYLDDKAFFPGWWAVPIVVLWMEWKQNRPLEEG